jgi:hypothetical protein
MSNETQSLTKVSNLTTPAKIHGLLRPPFAIIAVFEHIAMGRRPSYEMDLVSHPSGTHRELRVIVGIVWQRSS